MPKQLSSIQEVHIPQNNEELGTKELGIAQQPLSHLSRRANEENQLQVLIQDAIREGGRESKSLVQHAVRTLLKYSEEAMMPTKDGDMVEDHKTRIESIDKLLKLIGGKYVKETKIVMNNFIFSKPHVKENFN